MIAMLVLWLGTAGGGEAGAVPVFNDDDGF
jgi:hypothetical protein